MKRGRVITVLIPLLLVPVLTVASCSPIGPAVLALIPALSKKKSDKKPPPALVPPGQASNPSPSHSATSVPVTTNLSWDAAANTDSYEIYFGTDPVEVANADTSSAEYQGSQTPTFFDPSPAGVLDYDTTCYWRVDSVNAAGTTRGDLWGFATESTPVSVPEIVQNPTPADSATSIATDQALTWDAAAGATSYDIYFGTSATSVANATTASAEFTGSQTALTYDPGGVSYSTTYYWRVDSRNSVGPTDGDLWSFTTKPPPPVADFTADATSGEAPLTVSFTDASTGAVTVWSWNFGDSGTSSEQNPSHQYTSTGTYSVSLTVTGPGGSDTETKTDYVTVTSPGVLDTIYIATTGNDTTGDGTLGSPYATIQKGLDSATSGTTVIVFDGTHTGTGNKDLDFTGNDIYLKSSSGAANCIIDCQSSGRGFYFHYSETNAAIVEGFTIQNGNAGSGNGGGICCDSASPTIANCVIIGGTAYGGGGIFCDNSDMQVIKCTVTNNQGQYGGGITYIYSSGLIKNCHITQNLSSVGAGGGIRLNLDCYPVITNCIINGNTVPTREGGGVYCEGNSIPTITNCTIVSNSAQDGGGVSCLASSSPVLKNTVLWDNSASNYGNQIYTGDTGSSLTLFYCDYANGSGDVEGSGTVTPNNCITLDPLFVNASAQDYRLLGTSPCIDAGDNSLVPVGVDTDLDGDLRIRDGDADTTATVDIGAYEHRTWIEKFPADKPSPRVYHAMTYDSSHQVAVLFGGHDGAYCNDTWEWDGTNWVEEFPASKPSVRGRPGITYDSTRGVVVLFGGWDGTSDLSDTWEWDGSNWTDASPAGTSGIDYPSGRTGCKMTHDCNREVVVLFGGAAGSTLSGDTWEWDGNNWTDVSPGGTAGTDYPSPRAYHAMAYDSSRQMVVLFGGSDGSFSDETWEWNGTNWTQRLPTNKPLARYYHAMSYDSNRGVVTLFGGSDGSRRQDTWEWDGTEWTEKFPGSQPSTRYSAAMAYDSGRKVFILFGGDDGNPCNDTWEY